MLKNTLYRLSILNIALIKIVVCFAPSPCVEFQHGAEVVKTIYKPLNYTIMYTQQTTTIKATKTMLNNGVCFIKGHVYTVNKLIKSPPC